MIHVNVTGRCGNQLFQYAFARKISFLTGDEELEFDFFNVRRWQQKTNDLSFDDQLQHFSVLPYKAAYQNENVFQKVASKKQNQAHQKDIFFKKFFVKLFGNTDKWIRYYEPKLNRLGVYYQDTAVTFPVKTDENEKLLKGYFENRAYFDDIREILLQEFTPRYPEKEKNKELYRVIRDKESVCVSFRKWGEVDEKVRAERDVCGKVYYQKAINEMLRRVPDAVLIVFSDDVNWVRNTYDFGDTPVFFEDGTDEIWEKLRLMYSCKHFIMTTSTFTWWAQYLCRNEKKIVISPDHWYNGSKKSRLLDDSWIKVSADEVS